jgi:hypothetical protein
METWNIRKTGWLVVLLALASVAALYWTSLAQRPQGADAAQIKTLMIRGERLLEERNIAGAMGLVSRDYRDDEGFRYGSLRAVAGRKLHEARSVDVTLPERLLRIEVRPDGREAVAQARVDLRVASDYDTVHDASANLTFRFRKEPVRYYLMFPGEEWRLVKMEGWQALGGE